MSFEHIFRDAVPLNATLHTRSEGTAFLIAAKKLYGLAHLDYIALNIPAKGWKKTFTHCRHACDSIAHCVSDIAADQGVLKNLTSDAQKPEGVATALRGDKTVAHCEDSAVLSLRALHGEIALAAVSWAKNDDSDIGKREIAIRDLRLLMNYFHSQLLRINGVDCEEQILMSAREIDCLSWTAAGKTAWEASIILGISERTVRFHLNVAREKLKCATTTQAVAKAISHQLIELSA